MISAKLSKMELPHLRYFVADRTNHRVELTEEGRRFLFDSKDYIQIVKGAVAQHVTFGRVVRPVATRNSIS